jgi:GNAT superfamily N-acetyltransferase
MRRIGADGFVRTLDTILTVYAAAMNPPADQLPGRLGIMRGHATYPDFDCRLAVAEEPGTLPGTVQECLVGFAYGFHGTFGQWWHEVVHTAMTERITVEERERWLGDACEIAEVHVFPTYQGRGLGRRLVLDLCEGRPERTAVLSTHDKKSPARHLYRKLGFTDLLTGFRFPGSVEPYAIMGATLPLTDPGPRRL